MPAKVWTRQQTGARARRRASHSVGRADGVCGGQRRCGGGGGGEGGEKSANEWAFTGQLCLGGSPWSPSLSLSLPRASRPRHGIPRIVLLVQGGWGSAHFVGVKKALRALPSGARERGVAARGSVAQGVVSVGSSRRGGRVVQLSRRGVSAASGPQAGESAYRVVGGGGGGTRMGGGEEDAGPPSGWVMGGGVGRRRRRPARTLTRSTQRRVAEVAQWLMRSAVGKRGKGRGAACACGGGGGGGDVPLRLHRALLGRWIGH
jgi:hypothetical protein